MAATELSTLAPVTALGLATTLQLVPSQCRISVWSCPPLLRCPTAQALFGASAVMPPNWLLVVPGLGLGTICHWLPFQCSISVWFPALPIAQTSPADVAAV